MRQCQRQHRHQADHSLIIIIVIASALLYQCCVLCAQKMQANAASKICKPQLAARGQSEGNRRHVGTPARLDGRFWQDFGYFRGIFRIILRVFLAHFSTVEGPSRATPSIFRWAGSKSRKAENKSACHWFATINPNNSRGGNTRQHLCPSSQARRHTT